MTCSGKVMKDSVKLPPGVHLPDGTTVEIILPESGAPGSSAESKPGWFKEEFKEFIGVIKEGPSDLAENHDHYAHGTPRRPES
jgi:hypothetical protein